MDIVVKCPKGHRQAYRSLDIDLQAKRITYACPHCKVTYSFRVPMLTEEEFKKAYDKPTSPKQEEKKDGSSILHKVQKESTDAGGKN